MDSKQIREKFIKFFVGLGHKEIAPARLIPENDPTTLFTSSGMQQLVPYLLGEKHPAGKKLVNSQPCFRAEDIDEVGDSCHTTFFEMLGNWSLGDYFKEDQLKWCWEFLTKELGLPKEKLYVSVFEGNDDVPKDTESYEIWKSLEIPEDHIFFYGVDKNWWSRSGSPDKMPAGEIGGPDSEIFYEFIQVEHDKKYGEKCHPNCPCGRFLEIGNSVFIEYQKQKDGTLKELPQKNVDFGGGLERLTAATENEPDIFKIDLFWPIIEELQTDPSVIKYGADEQYTKNLRIIADHMKASVFLIKNGVAPNNKLHGYMLRRLLRRAAAKAIQTPLLMPQDLRSIPNKIIDLYKDANYFSGNDRDLINSVVEEELNRFARTLGHGLKEFHKLKEVSGKDAFNLFQTYGFPLELTEELAKEKSLKINKTEFEKEFKKHQELSRTASAGMFKGGLVDQSEIVIKYHTATHLLHQALRDVLGPQVFQKGSNITTERLRFDFSFDRKMTEEEIKKVEDLVNQKIAEDLKVTSEVMSKEEALKSGALGFFNEKYGDKVTVYTIGGNSHPERVKPFGSEPQGRRRAEGSPFSREICGGPHVEHTGVIGKIQIIKEEAVSSGIRRIRAEIVIR